MPASEFFITSLSSFLLSNTIYWAVAPRFGELRQKSWIVTFVASSVMSLCSLPFFQDFIFSGGDILAILRRTQLARATCGSFHGFLLSDLVVGLLSYPQQLSPLLGWTHHLSYMLISQHVASKGWGHVFCACLFMEVPTWLLASSFLWPKLRNDVTRAVVYFLTRIVLHGALLVEAVLPSPRNKIFGGSFTPALLLLIAFVMHVLWFAQSVKGIVRRTIERDRPKGARTVQESKVNGLGAIPQSPWN